MNLKELMQTPIGEYVPTGSKPDVLWRYDSKTLKVYTADCHEKSRLGKVAGAEMACRYFFIENAVLKRGWDFLIPHKRMKTVCRILSSSGRQGNNESKA